MALEIRQSLKLSQQLVITPQLQQAIRLLQLTQPELCEVVEQELLENPLLEEDTTTPSTEESKREENDATAVAETRSDASPEEDKSAEPASTAEKSDTSGEEVEFKKLEPEDFDWENYLNTYNSPEIGINNAPEELPSYENTIANPTSLFDHLMWQIKLSDFDGEEVEAATLILDGINDDGYFIETLADVAEKCGQSEDFVEFVLEKIQALDPLGVGARNLQECLLLQCQQFGAEAPLLNKIIEEHLPQLERKDYPRIAKNLKIPISKVQELAKIIHELEPKPGREFSTGQAQYITPDVYVNKVGDEWLVVLNEDGLPKLKVNGLYKAMVEGKSKSDTKEYVQDKLRSAMWLIKSIHQRQRTLYKTSKTIVKFQQKFFEKGIEHLKPMILRDVANEIEMHESTVSRVTTNKYMHTPHGTFELKFFFNTGIATGSGEAMASESIKNKIKTLIAAENPKKPLSDQAIVDMLSEDGDIEIARRTVAKYREIMGILPSSKRRQLY